VAWASATAEGRQRRHVGLLQDTGGWSRVVSATVGATRYQSSVSQDMGSTQEVSNKNDQRVPNDTVASRKLSVMIALF